MFLQQEIVAQISSSHTIQICKPELCSTMPFFSQALMQRRSHYPEPLIQIQKLLEKNKISMSLIIQFDEKNKELYRNCSDVHYKIFK